MRATVSFVRTQGLRLGGEWGLLTALCKRPEAERHRVLETELFNVLRESCSGLRPNEVLIGSTEVLESLFGKWKTRERQESKSGMTSLLLSLGALVGEWSPERMGQAFLAIAVKNVKHWCEEHLPPSIQSQRRLAFSAAGP